MATKIPQKAQVPLFIGGGVLVLVVVGGLIFLLFRGIKDATDGVNDVVGGVAEGLGGLAQGVGEVAATTGELVGDLAGGIGDAAGVVVPKTLDDQNRVKPDDIDPGLPDLVLKVVKKWDDNSALFKITEVIFEVTAGGVPVPGATVTGVPTTRLSKAQIGTQTLTTRSDGMVGVRWGIQNLPLTDREDDIVWIATKSGYNPSPGLLVK